MKSFARGLKRKEAMEAVAAAEGLEEHQQAFHGLAMGARGLDGTATGAISRWLQGGHLKLSVGDEKRGELWIVPLLWSSRAALLTER